MHQIDYAAQLIPGRSAAGLSLGTRSEELESFLATSNVVEYRPGFNLVHAVQANSGILRVRGLSHNEGDTVYVSPDTIRLVFDLSDKLACIYVFRGYVGAYRGVIVGDPLSLLANQEDFSFDHGDEMYYRTDEKGEYLEGLAVVATEAEPAEYPKTKLVGFCVHDWTMFQKV